MAPITGGGMIVKTVARPGMNANKIKMTPQS
jgi:hypothetical protein